MVAALACASCAAAGCDGAKSGDAPRPPTKPVGRPANVLVITLDTTRADHLGCYGRARVKTPALDRLAAEGTLFEHAFTPVPSTFPSHSSLFTGLYPASHGVHDNAVYFLGDEATTLAELLHSQGHATAAFVSAFVLDRQFGLAQGFDRYDDAVDRPLMATDVSKIPKGLDPARKKWEVTIATAYQRRGDATTKAALEWLGGLGTQPFFLWVHYFDSHQPYQPPPPWDRAYDPDYRGAMDGDQRRFWRDRERGAIGRADLDHMIALYDGEISWLDEQVGRLLDGLRQVGRFDETLIVVVADHGEGLGEHSQLFEHNSEIYDETVRVPLLVRRPDASARGERVGALVRTLDVAPTILEWLRLPAEPGMQGRSLLAFTDADAARREAAEGPGEILLEALRERQVNVVSTSLLGLRGETFKAIATLDPAGTVQKFELYDFAAEGGERRDVAASQPEKAAKLRARLLEMHEQLPRPSSRHDRELDELDNEALRALGYAGKPK
jgi:arylsulfatase A-like enzyme